MINIQKEIEKKFPNINKKQNFLKKSLFKIAKKDLIVNMGAYFSTFSYNSLNNNRLNSISNFYSIHDAS